jgi:rare lipoprotein A (peptidoglycan hydrolase)
MACGKEIALGSLVEITYKEKKVQVRCNDRGSFSQKYGRIADLSKATFATLASLDKGVIEIQMEVLE